MRHAFIFAACFLLRRLLLGRLLSAPPSAAARAPAAPRGRLPAAGITQRLAVPAAHLRARRQIRRIDGSASAPSASAPSGAAPPGPPAPRPAPPPRPDDGAPAKLSTGPPISSIAADAGIEDVLERRFRALVRHAAIAVGDGADLHAVDHRVRLRLRNAPKIDSLLPSTAAAGIPASASFPNSRLV